MKWSIIATLFLVPGVASEAPLDENSLLQTQRQSKQARQKSKTSLAAGSWQKTMETTNSTAKCSCLAVSCGLSFCAECASMACACEMKMYVPDCTCCNGDEKCIAKKIEAEARRNLLAQEAEEKYRLDWDKYRRQLKLDARKQEDQEWKHAQDLRDHAKDVRKAEDARWKGIKASHQKIKEDAKSRRQDFKEYISDLSDVVKGVLHELDGGDTMVLAPFDVTMPNCDCPPPVICPPEPRCPFCPARCPPCRDDPSLVATCDEECEEDKIVKDYVQRYVKEHAWFLVEKMPDPVTEVELGAPPFDEPVNIELPPPKMNIDIGLPPAMHIVSEEPWTSP